MNIFVDCSKYWVCQDAGVPCLMECGQCGDSPLCDGKEALFFDMDYPDGPACNWPQLVDCDGDNEII